MGQPFLPASGAKRTPGTSSDTDPARDRFACCPPPRANPFRRIRSVVLSLILVVTLANAQSSFAVPGIDGLTFHEADSSFTLVVADSFSMHGVRVFPDSLILKYDRPSGSFLIFGKAKVVLEDSILIVQFGDLRDPGIAVVSRSLASVSFEVRRSFTIKGLSILPDSLHFFLRSDSTFGAYGSSSVIADKDTIKTTAGSLAAPGIVFQSGELKSLSLLAQGKFKIKALELAPDSLGFEWRAADTSFTMMGSLTVLIGKDSIKVSAGTKSKPGIVYTGGALKSLDLSVGGKFSIKSVTILPDSLGFGWHAADTSFAMYGRLSVIADKDTIKTTAGSLAAPGIVFQSGELKSLSLLAQGKFKIKALELAPDSLGFEWRAADTSFTMMGSLTVLIGKDSIKVSAGTKSKPGIVYTGGALKSLDLSVGGKFSIKSVTILPDSLGFGWHAADTSFAMYGRLSVIADKDTIKTTAGSLAAPGIVFQSGELKSLSLLAQGKFKIKALELAPDSLGFEWRAADTSFTMMGSLTVLIGKDSIKVSAGTKSKPGIVYTGGALKSLDLSVGGKFSIKSVTILPDSLGFGWHAADTSFAMYGRLSVIADKDTIKTTAGSLAAPGIVFQSGELKSLSLLAQGKFKIKALELAPDSLGFEWRAADTSFTMMGSLTVLIGKDSIKVSAGTKSKPGIVYTGGALKSLDLSVGGKFSIKSVTILPDSLGFGWHAADTSFAMYGRLSVIADKDTIKTTAGSLAAPGIVFQSGELKSLSLLAQGKFKIKALELAPDSLGFEWRAADTSFTMMGSLTVLIGKDSIKVSAGTKSKPGIVYTGGALKSLDLSVGGKFSIKSVTILPDSLGFGWHAADTSFAMYGRLSVIADKDTIKTTAGSLAAPGIVFQSGELKSLSLLAQGKFKIKALELAPDSLGFEWRAADTSFTMMGSLTVLIGKDSIKVSAGTKSKPGIVYTGGALKSLDLSVGGKFSIKSVTILPDSLGFGWHAADTSFAMYGRLSVIADKDTIKTTAGSLAAPGIVFQSGELKSLSLLAQGKFKIKALELAPDSLGFEWRAADTSFTMMGSLTVLIGKDSIKVSAGTKSKPGIVYTGGALKSLDLSVGGKFSIKSVTILPDSLGFGWHAADTSFAMYGRLSVIADKDTIKTTAGSLAAPGIVFQSGELKSLSLLAQGKFKIKALELAPDSLGFEWRAADTSFTMMGSLTVLIGKDSIKVSAGTKSKPGIVYTGGALKSLDLSVGGKFSIKSVTILPDSLGFGWHAADTSFAMYGRLSVIADKDTIKTTAGSLAAPGIVFQSGELKSLSLLAQGKFKIKALELAPDSLGFEWRAADTSFTMMGSLTVLIGKDSIKVSAGTKSKPGIVYTGGALKSLDLSVGGKFSIKSVTILPDSLGFGWHAADTSFAMYGRLSVIADKDTIKTTAGSLAAPGIVFQSGELKSLSLLAQGKFKIKALELAPDSLGFEWRAADTSFTMMGSLTVLIGKDSIKVSAGTKSKPGIVYTGGALKSLDLSVGGKFSIKSVTILPDSLGFGWHAADTSFAMYGRLSVIADKDTIKTTAGSLAAPGIVFQSGELKSLSLLAQGKFKIKALELAPDSLGFEWRAADTSFTMMGSLTVLIGKDSIKVSAGTKSKPGIVYTGGALKSLDLSVGGKFSIKSVTILPDSLGFGWHAADTSFAMYGRLSVIADKDTIKTTAGSLAAPGIVFQSGELKSLSLLAQGKFKIKALELAPDSLGFEWRAADTSFTMMGSLTVLIGKDSIKVSAGTKSKPGIVYTGGALKSLDLSVGGKFSIKSVTILPDSLGIKVAADTGFAMYGRLSVIADKDTLKMAAGTLTAPGIVIERGQLTKMQLLANGTFRIKSLTFIPDSLGFEWRAQDTSFAMIGSLAVMVGKDSIKVSAGTKTHPGIVYAGGALKSLDLSVGGKFSYEGITVEPKNVGFFWAANPTNMFAMYGDLSVRVDSSVFQASFGKDKNLPGFVIVNGTVTKCRLSLTDTLRMSAFSLILNNASLDYDATLRTFSIWGGAMVRMGHDTVALALGDSARPGLSLVNGKVVSVMASVTASFTVGGLTLAPDSLTYAWDASSQTVTLYGSLSVTFEGHTTTLLAGTKDNPGIKVVNGAVKSLSLGVTGDLKISSLGIKPRGLSFAWADTGYFKLYGMATIMLGKDSISVKLGESTNPGMLISGGTLEYLNIGVTANFQINSLQIQPKKLTLKYDKPAARFTLFGSIAVRLASDSIDALLGDSLSPGIVYAKGSLQQVNIGITAGFTISRLSFKTDSLALVWASDSSYFKLSGGASIAVGPDTIACDFGSAQKPGLIIKGGELQYLSLNVNSDLKFGNLNVKTQDLDLVYSRKDAAYTLTGTCSIAEVFSVTVTLGNGDTPGVILDVSTSPPKFKIEEVTLLIEHAKLPGAIDLKRLQIKFQGGYVRESDVNVAFPGGWEVGAGIAFTNGTPALIDSIGVKYVADDIKTAIKLPNGMVIAGMWGSMKNLSHPKDLYFYGKVLFLYGGPETVDGKQLALLYFATDAKIDYAGISLGAEVLLGAYCDNDVWHGTLGKGSATLDVVWNKYAKLQGQFQIPVAPNQLVEISPLVYFSASMNFDALMNVTFYVPGFIPWVGGEKIGDASGAMRYHNGDLHHSYAAAWVSGTTLWWDWTAGAEFNFGDHSISAIGDGTVSQIQRDIKDDTKSSFTVGGGTSRGSGHPVRSIINSFVTTNPAPSILVVGLRWPSKADSTVVTVLGPEGMYELTRVERMKGDSASQIGRSQNVQRDFASVYGDSVATFIVAPYLSFTSDSSVAAVLPPGRYQVVCTSHNMSLDSVGLVVMPMYKPPKADIWITEGSKVNVKYSSMQTDSTFVDVFVSDKPSYTGAIIKQSAHNAAGKDGTAHVDTLFRYSPSDPYVGESDSLWFYAVIDDRLNPPSLTKIVGPCYMPPALTARITVSAAVDTVSAGLLVFIDSDGDGNWDTPSTGGLEINGVTDVHGRVRIASIPLGSNQVRVVVPPGYVLLSGNQRVDAVPIEYLGVPITLNLELRPDKGANQ